MEGTPDDFQLFHQFQFTPFINKMKSLERLYAEGKYSHEDYKMGKQMVSLYGRFRSGTLPSFLVVDTSGSRDTRSSGQPMGWARGVSHFRHEHMSDHEDKEEKDDKPVKVPDGFEEQYKDKVISWMESLQTIREYSDFRIQNMDQRPMKEEIDLR
jgi:hypothetical protein